MKDEDKTFENERKHMNEPVEDRGALDLTFLIEEHKKEIWAYKQKESNWIKADNLFQGARKIIEELTKKLGEQIKTIAELRYDNMTYKKEIDKLIAEKKK